MKLRCAYCGAEHTVPILFLKLWNLFFDKYYFTCQKCLKCNCYGMYLRIFHDSTDKVEKEANKQKKKW